MNEESLKLTRHEIAIVRDISPTDVVLTDDECADLWSRGLTQIQDDPSPTALALLSFLRNEKIRMRGSPAK